MVAEPNAAELTVDQAWFIAETVGAGTFPWVLAITTPYTDAAERGEFADRQVAELTRMGIMSTGGAVNPAVADWVRVVCFPDRWLDLRYVGPAQLSGAGDLLRGVIAWRGDRTDRGKADRGKDRDKAVVALRNAQLVTFTPMDIDDALALVPVLGAGLGQRSPARFNEFSLPARVGARADEKLRNGASLAEIQDYLGIPESARPVVESVFTGPRSYVEIVAGCHHDGQHSGTEVGMSIVDATPGRVLVSPSRAFDGEWISTFSPGTAFAVAVAVEQLIAGLPDGQWFREKPLSRDFSAQSN
jgi:hypothetical protein